MSWLHSEKSQAQIANGGIPGAGLAAWDRRNLYQALVLSVGALSVLAALPVALLYLGPPARRAAATPVVQVNPIQVAVEQELPSPVVTLVAAGTPAAEKTTVATPSKSETPTQPAPGLIPADAPTTALVPKEPVADNSLTIQVPDGNGGLQLVLMDFTKQKADEQFALTLPQEPSWHPAPGDTVDDAKPTPTWPQQTHWIPGQPMNPNVVVIRNALTGQIVGQFVPGMVTPYRGNIHGELPSPSINPFSLLKKPGSNPIGVLPFPPGKNNGLTPGPGKRPNQMVTTGGKHNNGMMPGPGKGPNSMVTTGGFNQFAMLQNQGGAKVGLQNFHQGGGKANFQMPNPGMGMGKASGGMPMMGSGGGKANGMVPSDGAAAKKCCCK